MLAHLMIGTCVGLVAAVAMGLAGTGALGILLTYSAVGTMALLTSATVAMMRADALDAAH